MNDETPARLVHMERAAGIFPGQQKFGDSITD
jgi:hypothetical protein